MIPATRTTLRSLKMLLQRPGIRIPGPHRLNPRKPPTTGTPGGPMRRRTAQNPAATTISRPMQLGTGIHSPLCGPRSTTDRFDVTQNEIPMEQRCRANVPSHPNSIPAAPSAAQTKHGAPFILQTDASGVGIAAVLYQDINNQRRIIRSRNAWPLSGAFVDTAHT